VPRDRLLTDDEIAGIWKAAKCMGGYGRLVQLLIATGQRANQIIKLSPSWIDANKRLLTFPASVMKSNRPHVLPYGNLSAALLGDLSGRPTTYQAKKKHELDALSGLSGYVLHDFRRYYSSPQARLKTPIDCTEMILSHRTGSRSPIQQVYDQYDRMDEMREAQDRFEAHLRRVIDVP
jgi:integrase